MKSRLEILKGIHPGVLIDKELKKREIFSGRLAFTIDGRRSVNLPFLLFNINLHL